MVIGKIRPTIYYREPPGCGRPRRHRSCRAGESDGYTLLVFGLANIVSALANDKVAFDIVRDLAPVGAIFSNMLVMLVNPLLPVRSVPEFIAFAKANPGKINMGSPGVGSTSHLAGELFKMATGISMIHVPYRGEGPALADLMGGQIQVLFSSVAAGLEFVSSARLRPLAVTESTRSPAMPDVPTLSEFVPGYEVNTFLGFVAPRDTPAEDISILNREINAGLATANIQARYTAVGGTVMPGSPAEFGRLITTESEKWARVIKQSNIKFE